MNWRPVTERPPRNGFYFCWHAKWGRCVMGFRDGWGASDPERWLDEDGLPEQEPNGDGKAEVLTR